MRRAWIGLLAATACLAAACGNDDSKDSASSQPSNVQLTPAVTADSGATTPAPVPPESAPPEDDASGETGVAGSGSCATPSRNLESDLTTVQSATLCLLNAERSARRLRALRSNQRLASAAQRHSRDMVARRFFSHDTLGGGGFDGRVKRSGYLRGARGWTIGENIAWGSGSRATPTEIVRSWMNSPGHRANILSRRFREIGLGIAVGAPEPVGVVGLTYTTNFGSRT